MGANEKHDATYHGGAYVPDTDVIREQYVAGAMVTGFAYSRTEARTEFDRWLAQIRTEAKAEVYDHLAATAHNRFEKARMTGLAHETRHGPTKLGGAFALPETENKENKP